MPAGFVDRGGGEVKESPAGIGIVGDRCMDPEHFGPLVSHTESLQLYNSVHSVRRGLYCPACLRLNAMQGITFGFKHNSARGCCTGKLTCST